MSIILELDKCWNNVYSIECLNGVIIFISVILDSIYTVKFEIWILILIIYFIGKIECSIIIVLHLHFDIEHAFNIYKTAVLKSDKEN